MNAYIYLYPYLQHFCSIQQRLMQEAVAAIAIDAAAPAVTTIV